MRNKLVVLQFRPIFVCEHQERKVKSKVIFERDLEIPASLCELCSIKKSKI